MINMCTSTWLTIVYWICLLTGLYKTIVSLIGFNSDDLFLSVFAPIVIVGISVAILFRFYMFIWNFIWEYQEKWSYGKRITIPFILGLALVVSGFVFDIDAWSFPENNRQLFILYWWDILGVLAFFYGFNNLYEYSTIESKTEDSFLGYLMKTVVNILGALAVFVSSLVCAGYLTITLADYNLYLFIFFLLLVFLYPLFVLPFSLIKQAIVNWGYLREQTPTGNRSNYIKHYFEKYSPIFGFAFTWFIGTWILIQILHDGGSGSEGSNVIVLVNGLAMGKGSVTPPTSLVGLLLLFLSFFLFMLSAVSLTKKIVPLKHSGTSLSHKLSDKIFMIPQGAAEKNPEHLIKKYKFVTSITFVTLFLISIYSAGLNMLIIKVMDLFI